MTRKVMERPCPFVRPMHHLHNKLGQKDERGNWWRQRVCTLTELDGMDAIFTIGRALWQPKLQSVLQNNTKHTLLATTSRCKG